MSGRALLGLALLMLGLWRLIGGDAGSPLGRLLPGWPGALLGVLLAGAGFWLYRSCST